MKHDWLETVKRTHSTRIIGAKQFWFVCQNMNTFLKIVIFRLQLYSFETLSEVVSYTVSSCAALLFAIISEFCKWTPIIQHWFFLCCGWAFSWWDNNVEWTSWRSSKQLLEKPKPRFTNSFISKALKHQLSNLVYYFVLAVGFSYSQEYVLR